MTICTTDKCGQGKRKCPTPELCTANSDGSNPGYDFTLIEDDSWSVIRRLFVAAGLVIACSFTAGILSVYFL